MTILAQGSAGVNCFWNVGAKMEEFSERGELHARDSDTDSESADAKGTLSSMIQIKLAKRDSCTNWEVELLVFIGCYQVLNFGMPTIVIDHAG